ncbi:MAG: hypothetical protein ACO3JL_00670 [Myxococcota bacterium]
MKRVVLNLALVSACLGATAALAEDRPLIGDVVNGARLYREARQGKALTVDGAWLNRFQDDVALRKLASGESGFPAIDSDDELQRWDVLAYLRANHADLRDLLPAATHVLLSSGELDEHAVGRLKERVSLSVATGDEQGAVFALFTAERGSARDLLRVEERDSKQRDLLKPERKAGYVVFMPLKGLRGGGYEAAIAVNPQMEITAVDVRAPDGTAPDDLNQAARRFIGRGGRAKYQKLAAPGAGKAMQELTKPLSEAFLLGAERIYMYEVKEREYFAFDP